jgi:hypothetical protein
MIPLSYDYKNLEDVVALKLINGPIGGILKAGWTRSFYARR